MAQPASAEMQQAFQQAVAAAEPSIVRIETVGGRDLVGDLLTGTGPTTGVVVREDGYILTSRFNFIAQPASILVTLPHDAVRSGNEESSRSFAAEVVATDYSKMLTLLKIDADGLVPIEPAPQEEIRVGQWALALGRTFDMEFPNISVGIVSALNRIWGRAIQTDAKTSPVNYGGPLIDLHGRCLGIIVPLSPQGDDETAGVEWYDSGIGFAVPLSDVLPVLDRLIAGELLRRGLLGVSFVDRGPVSGEAKIVRVRPESPADKAGLQVDDVIIAVEDQPVEKLNDFKQALGSRYAEETLALTLRRGEETVETNVTLTDELKAYQFPTLGILPVRPGTIGAEDAEDGGVAVRHVFSESPAERAGLKRGDLITRVGEEAVASAEELAHLVSRIETGDETVITLLREGEEQTVQASLVPFPDAPPGEFPPVRIAVPDGQPEARTGRFNEQLPASDFSFWMFVPDDYNPEHAYGLLVWMHPAGDTMEAETMRAFSDLCRERGIILLAPRAGDVSGWAPEQEDLVKATVEWVRERYRIDSARIAVMGSEDSGVFATQLAFKYRDLFRGLVGLTTILRVPPPDNSPDHRLQILLTVPESAPQRQLVEKSAEALQERKFPAHLLPLPENSSRFPADLVETLALWLDALDRI
jgi:serine protease Do